MSLGHKLSLDHSQKSSLDHSAKSRSPPPRPASPVGRTDHTVFPHHKPAPPPKQDKSPPKPLEKKEEKKEEKKKQQAKTAKDDELDDGEADGERLVPPDSKHLEEEEGKEKDAKDVKDRPTGTIKFDLCIALKTLSLDKPELILQLEDDEQKVRALRQNIVNAARKNHILERELQEIDDKIKLLIKNRITVQEVIAQSAGLLNPDEKGGPSATEGASLHGKRSVYEDFFYLLQSKPRYLAKMARVVLGKEIPVFVQTIVFDLFGDQYDTREERLLLSLFRLILEDELSAATEKGSLLRANTAVTQMLSAYARRGQGLGILREILERPLKSLTSQKDLNLEINPMKVYNQLIQDYETETGKQSDLPRNIDDDTAAQNEEVKRVIDERRKGLQENAENILTRIMDAVESVPYGMRWICKQLGDLSRKRFPDIDRYQVGSLMGGYIYLRFFNPVIVTPDAMNFISTKPNRVMRRNLILIAKILQNLSNGLLFGDKETYMKALNDYIRMKMEPLQKYFAKLVKIDDLNDALQVDKYLEHTSDNNIQVSLNQIFLLHEIAAKNLDEIAPESDDRMREVVTALGKAPAQVKKEDNRTVTLQLSEKRSKRDMSTTADAFATPRINPLFLQAKKLLLSVLRRLPDVSATQTNILGFLEEQKTLAKDKGDTDLVESLTNVVSMLKTLNSMNLLKKESTPDETFNVFLWGFVQESLNRRTRIQTTNKRLKLIEQAMASILEHHKHLQSRLEIYKMYLENVRKGQADGVVPKAPPSKKEQVHKFSHKQLEDLGVVSQTSAAVRGAVLKKCSYAFSLVAPGKFKVELLMKKGVEVKLLKKPMILNLEDLLQMQERGNSYMDVDSITINVNLLIHLLNVTFLAKQT